MLVTDDLPELGSDLVAALAGLQVDDFSHVDWLGVVCVEDLSRLTVESCRMVGLTESPPGWLASCHSWQLSHTHTVTPHHTSHLTPPDQYTLTMVTTISAVVRCEVICDTLTALAALTARRSER